MSSFLAVFTGAAGWPDGGSPGGGAPPAWARTGSIADIDFVNNPPRAWTSTGGEVAFANFNTILGESILVGTYAYDPALVDLGVSYGLGSEAEQMGYLAFIGDMATAFNFNFTVIAEFSDILYMEFVEATFATDIVSTMGSGQQPSVNDQFDAHFHYSDGRNLSAGAHKFGLTLTQDLIYAAIDNESLYGTDPSPPFGPVAVMNPEAPVQPTDFVVRAARLKRLTVYNPIKTEAEQRTLTA